MFELVDDADVGHPSYNQRYIEVDQAGCEDVAAGSMKWSTRHYSKTANVCEDQERDVERHVVDPYVNDNRHSHTRFESRSTEFLQSEKSAE